VLKALLRRNVITETLQVLTAWEIVPLRYKFREEDTSWNRPMVTCTTLIPLIMLKNIDRKCNIHALM